MVLQVEARVREAVVPLHVVVFGQDGIGNKSGVSVATVAVEEKSSPARSRSGGILDACGFPGIRGEKLSVETDGKGDESVPAPEGE
jgi:hypothetical protein